MREPSGMRTVLVKALVVLVVGSTGAHDRLLLLLRGDHYDDHALGRDLTDHRSHGIAEIRRRR